LFNSLKNELVRHRQFQNHAEVRYAIVGSIDRFSNGPQLYQAFGCRSPEEFKLRLDE
jgi:hypothetical protein